MIVHEPDMVANILLEKLGTALEENLSNDQFGVEELAKKVGMSRSQLHRKLTTSTGQSISQYIREYRLERAMELLKSGHLTAAEVAHQVGFGSPTYFSKCFNGYYGFTPGEVKTKMAEDPTQLDFTKTRNRGGVSHQRKGQWIVRWLAIVIVSAIAFVYVFNSSHKNVAIDDKSIAILPFKNLSADRRNEYFSEGVIEAIRTNLAQVRDLRVVSRTSVEQYRQTEKSARQIAGELGVSRLLEGSIQRSNNQIRIDVRLVDGLTEAQVWGKTYHRELEDVFAIQTEIAEQVAAELNAKLSAEERTKLSKADTDIPEAYDLYLKGAYEYRTYTNKGAHNAIELLTRAIALDSNYARAYASLANSYFGLASVWGAELSPVEAFQKGKPLIDKALALDPALDEAHMLMGFYKLYNDWDFDGAEIEYRKAIVSNHPDALAVYIDYLNFTSRHKEAMELSERLNEIDPYYPNSRMIYSYCYNDRFEDALEFSQSRLEMFNNYSTMDAHGFLLLNMERYSEAIVYFQKAISQEGIRYPRMLGWMGAALAKSGEEQKAHAIIAELKSRLANGENGSIAFFVAVIHSALDEKDEALNWLTRAYNTHDMEMPWLMTEPQFYNLHQEPEFLYLAKKMGFELASGTPYN